MDRNGIIKWTGIGVFILTGLAIVMPASLGSSPTLQLCILVASFAVLALACEALWLYLIVPPIKDDDSD
ncbi:MAG: hypothetical protein FWH27_11865 [Planctomycetaceae bacterium]|nr:hypothetical protein [Planctomycetaceae bacterium]